MKLKENMTSNKLRGGYYTPMKLVDFLVKWGIGINRNIDVLEPSCGDGKFMEGLLNYAEFINSVTGIEIVESEAKKSSNAIKDFNNFKVINQDFYEYYEKVGHKYDVILGNPPYIRYQYLSQSQRDEHIQILKSSDMKANKLINAWVSFVVACVNLMKDNSRIGLVLPAELLQVKYAEDLRLFLMRHLQKITVITFSELIFPEVEQEVVLLMGEKDTAHDDEHKIRVINYQNVNELIKKNIELNEFKDIKFNDSKWTRYFLSSDENDLIDLYKTKKQCISFNEVADADIGITTGNNKYFCLNEKTVKEFNLYDYTRPLIARSVSIRGLEFTNSDWTYNIDKGSFAYLLDSPNVEFKLLNQNIKEYVKYGERNNEHTGYKCSIRQNWYCIPSIWSPDAFFLRRNYKYPKFILNTDIKAVSTDTMHRIRIKDKDLIPQRLIVSYYNSIGLAFSELEGRSYGGGVLEILPGELEKLTLVNTFLTNLVSDTDIMYVFNRIDEMIRTSQSDDIVEVLDFVDNYLLIGILSMEKEDICKFRNIWNKIRERRLNRGKKKG